jgi:isoquinoline 1-oxidoreductase beta subunit
MTIARRSFLVAAGMVGGGVLIGAGAVAVRLKSLNGYRLPATDGETSFGAWLTLARDGQFEVVVPNQEMGQGIYSLAILLVAEGLGVEPEAVRAVPAPIHARFANPVVILDGLPFDPRADSAGKRAVIWTFEKILRAVGLQVTGGSSSTRNIAEPIRRCAMSARDMLLRAAAQRFGVSAATLRTEGGRVVAPDGRSATYGELAAAAGRLEPVEMALPPLGPGVYVGKGIQRPDSGPKAGGLARYGIDTREPGQLYAAIRHSPRIGGALVHATIKAGLPGVRGVVEGSDYVAVVAESFQLARSGLETADIAWDDSKALRLSSRDVFSAYRAALDKGTDYAPRWVIDSAGSAAGASGRKVAATYEVPFLAHATMEPMNATALVTDTTCKLWAGHQSGSLVRMIAAGAANVSSDAVEVVTPYLGGGFGRRADVGYVAKAVEIARHFTGVPVQTIWSREEDLRDDVYRPAAMADITATLDDNGLPTSLIYRAAVPSVTDQFIARIFPYVKGGLLADRTTVDGAVYPLYAIPNRSIENFAVDLGIPVGFWRSVGYSVNAFFFESFIDELAAAAGVSPIAYRAQLLHAFDASEASRRARVLLDRLARFDADHPLATGDANVKIGRGIALTECFHSFVGHLADVEIRGREIRVRRVFAAVDCGFAIDPPNVVAQTRSAINFGLSAALLGRLDIEDGRVVQKNFDSYPVVTLDTAPDILVDIVNSGDDTGGVGEIGTPGIAPAVGNAIYAATGTRLRALPFGLPAA